MMMADPNGMGTGLGAEHGQHQQGGSSGTLAQQPLQGVLPMHQGMPYPPGPSGMPAGVPSGMYQPAPFMPMPQQQQNEQLRMFWQQQNQEIQQVGTDPAEFKNHQLPLARIKKIMKSDEDVRMISAEAPVLFAKACEMFILELTLRSWNHSEENKRRTLQRNDIAAAITRTDIFDFLVDIVPREERCDDGPRPQPMPSMPVPGMGYWQQQQQPPPQQQQQQQPPMQAGPGDQHMGLPQQRQPGMQMDPAMMQAYYMQQQQVAAAQQQQQQQQHMQQQQQQLQFQHQQQQGVPQGSFDHQDGQPNGE